MSDPQATSTVSAPNAATVSTSTGLVVRVAVCGLVALVSAVALMILPLHGRTTTWTWTPTLVDPADAAVDVAAGAPNDLTAEIPCRTLQSRTLGDGRAIQILGTTGTRPLRLGMTRGRLWVESDDKAVPELSGPIGDAPCTVRFHYAEGTDSATLDTGSQVLSARLTPPPTLVPGAYLKSFAIEGLHTDPALKSTSPGAPDGLRVSLVTRPATIAWPMWRWLLIATIAAAAFLAWLQLAFVRYRPTSGYAGDIDGESKRSPWVTLSDALLLVVAITALFLVPPLSDDGWVLTTGRNYSSLGFFSNYFTASAAPQPQGFWWALIEQLWLRDPDTPLLVMRLPSLVLVLLAWWVFRRHLLDRVFPDNLRPVARAAAAVTLGAFILSWTPTLRPEPVVALLLVLQFILVLRYARSQSPSTLLLAGLVAGLAFSLHQSGWVVVTAGIAMVAPLWRWWRSSRNKLASVFLVVSIAMLCAGLVVGLLMLHSNFAVASWSNTAFSREGVHDLMFKELERLDSFAGGQAPLRVLCLALVGLAIVGFLVRVPRKPDSAATLLGRVALWSLLGLLLTSSKWIWHVAAVWPAVAALMGVAAVSLARDRGGATGAVALVGATAVLVTGFLASLYPGVWGQVDSFLTNTHAWDLMARRPIFWVIVGIPLAAVCTWLMLMAGARLGARDGSTRSAVPALGAGVAVLVIVAASSLAPMVTDATRGAAAAWPDVVATSMEQGSCGVAGAGGLQVPTALRALPRSTDQMPASVPAKSQPLVFDRVGFFKPADVPVWTVVDGQASGATDWYDVSAGRPMRTWVQSNGLPYSVRVRWRDARGAELPTTTIERIASESYWQVIELAPPEGAAAVSLEWPSPQGPVAVLSPVAVVASTNLNALVGGRPVWRSPYSAMWSSCLAFPRIDTGIVQDYDWAIASTDEVSGFRLSTERVLNEEACLDLARGTRFCIFRSVPPRTLGVTRTYGTARW